MVIPWAWIQTAASGPCRCSFREGRWQSLELSGISMVAVQSESEIFALSTLTSGCTSPDTQLLRLNSAENGWVALNKCFSYISAGDGLLAGSTSAGVLSYSSDPTASSPTWTTFTTADGPWGDVTVYNSSIVYTVQDGRSVGGRLPPVDIYSLNLQTGAASFYLAQSIVNHEGLAASANGYLFVLSYDGLAAYNPQTGASYSFTGAPRGMTSIGGGFGIEMFILNSSGTPYHLLTTALSFTTTVSGPWPCASNCPNGTLHTLMATASFNQGGLSPGSTQTQGSPQNFLTVSHKDDAGECDPFVDDPSSVFCQASAEGFASCPVMGSLLQEGGTFSVQLGPGTRWSKTSAARTAIPVILQTALQFVAIW
jgi:hypothetical protein